MTSIVRGSIRDGNGYGCHVDPHGEINPLIQR